MISKEGIFLPLQVYYKIENLALPPTHINKCKYNNEIDMVDKLLTVYSVIKFNGKD
jgi:hypothetical protein